MNYEQKYTEALERARYYHSKDYMLINSAIENIFPELAESEDVRIRKGLVKAFGTIGKKDWGGLVVGDILDWLEKQGEKLDADEVIEWINNQACLGYIEDIEVEKFVKQFKKDFGL